MGPRNPQLRDSFEKAVTEVDELIRDRMAGGSHDNGIAYMRPSSFTPPEESRPEAWKRIQISLGGAVDLLWNEIRSLPSFARARDILRQPTMLKLLQTTTLYRYSVQSDDDWSPILERSVIMHFIEFVLFKGLDQFHSIYPHFEEYIHSKEICVSQIAQLRNFESEAGTIRLEENLQIRRLTNDEVRDIARLAQMSMPAHWPPKDLLRHEYGIESWVTLKKQTLLDDAPRYPYQPEHVLVALRLFKPGAVFYNTVVDYHHDWKYKAGLRDHATGGTWEKSIAHKQMYLLNKDEIESVVHLWETVKDADTRLISVAIARLESGLTREDPKDRLIDFMIGLESLFGVGEGELSYRMATRLAWFLHPDQEDFDSRKEVYSRFRTAYELRSKAVHGVENFTGKLRNYNDTAQLLSLVDVVEDYLRQSTCRFLSAGQPESWEDVVLARPHELGTTSSSAG